jgi:hypothetical protein
MINTMLSGNLFCILIIRELNYPICRLINKNPMYYMNLSSQIRSFFTPKGMIPGFVKELKRETDCALMNPVSIRWPGFLSNPLASLLFDKLIA